MDQNQRYTVEYCADQLLLQPDCPVHVKKLQCTRDNLTGRLILQARFVNRSRHTVESVAVCISLRNEQGEEISSIRSLRLTGLYARAHRCFGDEKTIILPQSFSQIQVVVEQISFSDGACWMAKPDSAAIPIQPVERVFGRVQAVRYPEYWYCSCGMVNPVALASCSYCSGPIPRLTVDMMERLPVPKPAPSKESTQPEQPEPSPMIGAWAVPETQPKSEAQAASLEEDSSAKETFPDFQISPELEKAAGRQDRFGNVRWWILGAILALIAVGVLLWYVINS